MENSQTVLSSYETMIHIFMKLYNMLTKAVIDDIKANIDNKNVHIK